MYKIGDYIVKNGNGVCKVENVMHLDIYDLIDRIPAVQEISISNDKLREQKYKEIIKDFEPRSLLRIAAFLRIVSGIRKGQRRGT